MLVLARKLNETIVLPTVGAAVQVLGVRRKVVRLGITAPGHLPVLRGELANGEARRRRVELPPEPPAAGGNASDLPQRPLPERLQEAVVGVGLCRLQLDAGNLEEANATLAALQTHLQALHQELKEKKDSAANQTPTQKGRRQRALVVEDNGNERELLAAFLRRSGLEVDTAGDGADALDYLRAHDRPDVVLLDMVLPRVDGPTVVRQIRNDRALAGLKIFGVTGHLPEEFHLERGPAGIDRWFHKPLDPAALLHDLRELGRQPASAT
jgi:carbon storage regulator CsrA